LGGVSEKETADIFSTVPNRAMESSASVATMSAKQATRDGKIQREQFST
jgi:hypothetical protein